MTDTDPLFSVIQMPGPSAHQTVQERLRYVIERYDLGTTQTDESSVKDKTAN